MNVRLSNAAGKFLRWLIEVVAEFRRIDPRATFGSIACVVLQKVFSVLTFFLPLKVILLLSSEGVPRYFQGFVSESTRDGWIVALAAASVLFYGFALLCESLERQYASTGSARVLRESNQLYLLRDQDNVARGYFSRFCAVAANGLFALLLSGVVAIAFPALLAFLVVLLVLEFLIAAAIIGNLEAEPRNSLAVRLREQVPNSLAVIASVNFLLVFAFLVVVFLYFGGINPLIAILSILLVRQLFSSLQVAVTESVRLSRQADRANALIFRHAPLISKVPDERARFYKHFHKEARDGMFADMLGASATRVDSRYVDRVRPAISMFDIEYDSETEGPGRKARCLVHHPSAAHLATHEKILFEHVDRLRLKRDVSITTREVDGFVCRIFDWGGHAPVKPDQWDEARRQLLGDSWSVAPSGSLRSIYENSKQLLHHRFTADLLSRLEVAIDTPSERAIYREACEALAEIQQTIESLPLFINNGGLAEPLTLFFGDREPVLLSWDRWELAPIGCGLDVARRDIAWFEAHCAELFGVSGHFEGIPPSAVLVAAVAAGIETSIIGGTYKRALGMLPQLCRYVSDAVGSENHSVVAK